MFSRDQVKGVTNEEITLSSYMINRMELWDRMLKGLAPWTMDADNPGVESLGIENAICREFANTVVSEMDTSLEIEELDEMYQKVINGLNEGIQDGLGLGEFAIKPIGDTGEYEIIPADRIIPFEFDSDGKLRRCAFVQVHPIGDTTVYYRLEIHELTKEGLRIRNRAFKGTDGNFGTEIQLTEIDEWAELETDITYPGMDRMDFGFYKNPLPNRIDKSPNGVSIFDSAIELIKKADIQFGRLDWEFESGERMVFGDYQTFKKDNNSKGYKWKAPHGKERMFVGMDSSDEFYHDHSPALRQADFISGLNEYLRQIERSVGLAYGDLSKNETVEKTATEILASKKRKYDMVTAIQKKLKTCLEDFAYSLAFYHDMYNQHIGFQCSFHDSIRTDEDTQRAQDRIDVQMGFMSKVEYRQKWYGEDEHTAIAKLTQAMQENQEFSENEGVIE